MNEERKVSELRWFDLEVGNITSADFIIDAFISINGKMSISRVARAIGMSYPTVQKSFQRLGIKK